MGPRPIRPSRWWWSCYGWIGDPDSDGIVCGDCATSEEIVQWIADGETVERGLRDEDD